MSQKSYQEGYDACKSGKTRSSLDSPYPANSEDAKDWARGFRSCVAEINGTTGSSSSGINRLTGQGRDAVRGSGFSNSSEQIEYTEGEYKITSALTQTGANKAYYLYKGSSLLKSYYDMRSAKEGLEKMKKYNTVKALNADWRDGDTTCWKGGIIKIQKGSELTCRTRVTLGAKVLQPIEDSPIFTSGSAAIGAGRKVIDDYLSNKLINTLEQAKD